MENAVITNENNLNTIKIDVITTENYVTTTETYAQLLKTML